mmetsp:Transcript_24177/g.46295  ORF Transcript_24177/g.46295 Transcript_24177/m.46295 type:complete len:240 (-) Transcript_24177:711-1430(-)
MIHGYLHRIVTSNHGILQQPAPLGAQNDGQPVHLPQFRGVDVIRIVPQCHGSGLISQRSKLLHPVSLSEIRPRDLEHSSHAHPRGSSVERIGAPGREEDSVHSQRGCASEDCPNVGGVLNFFEYDNPSGVMEDILDGSRPRTFHRAYHTLGELEAGELRQYLHSGYVNGDIVIVVVVVVVFSSSATTATGIIDCLPRVIAIQSAPFGEDGYRDTPALEGSHDDVGTFCDEHAFRGIESV